MNEKEEEDKGRKRLKKPLKVRDFLLVSLISLREKAWAYLGALSHEETGEKLVDLKEARLAIDALDAILNLIKTSISDEEKKALELDLANLRLNYVTLNSKKSQKEERPSGDKGTKASDSAGSV